MSLEFDRLVRQARRVVTDSGGLGVWRDAIRLHQ
jgi:hypothetical protein